MSILGAIGGLAGSALSGLFGNKAADKQAKLQTQFAKNAIQWKVEDAKKAGVHPLAALGATTSSYAPVTVGGGDFTQAGQSLGRALDAHMDVTERTVAKLAVEKAGLENDYLRAQIASVRGRLNQTSQPAPPGPGTRYVLDGQGETALPALWSKIEPPQSTTHVNTPFGRVLARPGVSDAQTYEDRWGEGADWIGGAANFAADALHTGNVAIERRWPGFYSWFRRNYNTR